MLIKSEGIISVGHIKAGSQFVFESLEPRQLLSSVGPVVDDGITSVTIGVHGIGEVSFFNQSGSLTHIRVPAGTAVIDFEGTATVKRNGGEWIVSGGVPLAIIGFPRPRLAPAVLSSITVSNKSSHQKASLIVNSRSPGTTIVSQITGGDMAAINAPGLYLSGSLTVAGINRLTLGQVSLSTISIGNQGSTRPLDVSLGLVDRSSLSSDVYLRTLTVESWTGSNQPQDIEPAGTVTAPGIGKIKSQGDFQALVQKNI
jgi:hypothetical protein